MFVLGNIVQAVAVILERVLMLYKMVLIVTVLISWVSADPFNPIVQFLRAVTEPLFGWIRRYLPFTTVGMLDLSPLVAFLLIWLIQLGVVQSLYELGARLR